MREPLTLLFLIIAYNLFLWFITEYRISPVPFFPADMYQVVLVLSYNSVLYLSWLFGERYKTVQWMGYLFFFQIVALSVYFSDLEIIVRNLPPVLLTFILVVLFESPTEKEIKSIEKEREALLTEIDRVRRERESIEIHLKELERELKEVEGRKEESQENLEEKIRTLQKEIKDYREKEHRLVETNRRLFQLLDMLRNEPETGGKEELKNLRRERKRLIRELIQLQELTDIYSEENQKLKEQAEKLKDELEKLRRKMGELEIQLENAKRETGPLQEIYREVLSAIPGVEFAPRAVEEFSKLPERKKKASLRELFVFSQRRESKKLESVTTLSGVFKLRFSGGRLYLKKNGKSWTVIGILPSERDKDKERYIREVLSKI